MENQQLKDIVKQIGLTPDAKASRKKIQSIATEEFVMSNAFRALLSGAKNSPKEFTALTGLDANDTAMLQKARNSVSARIQKTSPQRLGPEGVLMPSVEEAKAARQAAKEYGARGIAAEQKIQGRSLLEQIPAYLQGFAGGASADIAASKLKARGYDPALAYFNAGSDTDYTKQLGAETGYSASKTFPSVAASVPTMGIGGAVGDIATGALTSGVTSLSPAWMRAIAGGVRFAGHLGGAIQGGHIGSSLAEKAQQAITSGNLTPEERGVGQSMFGEHTPGGQLGSTAATLSLFKPTIKLAGAPLRKLLPQVFSDYGAVARNPYMMASVKDLGTRGYFVAQAGQGVDAGNQQAIKEATDTLGYTPTDINQLKPFGYKTQFEKLADMGMAALLGGTTRLGSALSRLGHIDTSPRPEFKVDDIARQIQDVRNKRNDPATTEPGQQNVGVGTAGSFPRFETIEGGVPITVEERSGTDIGVFPTRKESGEVVQKFNATFGRNANKDVAFTPTSEGAQKLISMNADNDFNVLHRNADGTTEIRSYGWTELPEQLKEQASRFFGTTTFIDRSTPSQEPYKYDPSAVSEDVPGRERRTYNTENDLRGVPVKDKNGNWKTGIYKLRKDGVDIPVRAVSDVDTRNDSVGVRTFSGNYYRVPISSLRDGADKPITTVKQTSWPERAYRKSYRVDNIPGDAVRFAESDWRISPDDQQRVKDGDEESWKDSYDVDALEANYEGAAERIGELQKIERGAVFADKYSGDRVVLLRHVDQTVEGRRMVGMLVYDVDNRVFEPYVMSYADAVDVSEAVKIKESLNKSTTSVEDSTGDTTDEGPEEGEGPEDGTGEGEGPEDGKVEGEGPEDGAEDGEGPEDGTGTDSGSDDIEPPKVTARGDSGVDFVKSQIVRYLKEKTNATRPTVSQQELESQDFIPQTLTQLKRFKDTGVREGVNREIVDRAYSELEEDGIIVAPSADAFDKEVARGANFESAVEKLQMGAKTPRDASLSFGDKFGSKDLEPEENLPQRTQSTEGKATGEREEGYEWYRQTEGEELRTTASVTQEEIKSIIQAYAPMQSRPRVFDLSMGFTAKDGGRLIATVQAEGVSNQEDVVRVLQQRWNSSEQEAKALAKYIDGWATGWAMTVARMEGVNINKRLMARKTDAEKAGAYTAFVKNAVVKELKDTGVKLDSALITTLANEAVNNNGKFNVDGKEYTIPIVESYTKFDTWKKDFREISIFNNTEANKQLLADLKQVYYEQHLGSFSQLTAGAVELLRPGVSYAHVDRAVRVLMDGTVSYAGQVIAVESTASIEVKLHELHHALLASMPRAIYHDILKSRFPSLEMAHLGYGSERGKITDRSGGTWLNTTHEEEMVAALTNAVMTSDINSYPFKYTYGVDAYEVHVAEAVIELGQLMRTQSAVINELQASSQDPTRRQWVMGNQYGRGEKLNADEVASNILPYEYTKDTTVRILDQSTGMSKQGKILKVNGLVKTGSTKRKLADASITVKFGDKQETYKIIDLLDKSELDNQRLKDQWDLSGIDLNTLAAQSKFKISRTGLISPELKLAGDAVARIFGHYQKFVNQQIKDVAPITPSRLTSELQVDTFAPAAVSRSYPFSPGYRWYVKTETAAAEYGSEGRPQRGYYQGEMSTSRLEKRMRDSYLGWLDVGGYASWMQLTATKPVIAAEPHLRRGDVPVDMSLEVMTGIHDAANMREQSWYASKEGGEAGTEADAGAESGIIKAESGEVDAGGDKPFELDFDVMSSPAPSSSPKPESEIDVDEGLTVDSKNIERYGNPSERRFLSKDSLTSKLASEDKIFADAIMSKLVEGNDAVEIYNSKSKRTVGFYVAEYDEAGKTNLSNRIQRLFDIAKESGNGDDVALDYLARIKNDQSKVDAITKHVVDLLTDTAQRRSDQDARFSRIARTREDVARRSALDKISDDIYKSLRAGIERTILNSSAVTLEDGGAIDSSMTYEQKQTTLEDAKAGLIDSLKSQYNGVLDDAMIGTMVDQSIQKILANHIPTEAEAQEAQEIRQYEEEQLRLQLQADRQDNSGEQAKFFQKQLSFVLDEAMKNKAKAASNNELWRRVIANNIFGAYINNWVMKGFRLRVPEAMYLRYPLAKNTRVLDYLAGSFDVGTIRSGLSNVEAELSTWGDMGSGIPHISNAQYRQIEVLRTTWRQIMRNVYKSEFAKKDLSPAREITELNKLMDVFREEYKIDERQNAKPGDVIEKNKDLILKFLSKTQDPELKQRFLDWVYEYNRISSQSTWVGNVLEDLAQPKEKRKGYTPLRVESKQYDDMLNGKKVVYYVTNWTTLADSLAHVKTQQATIEKTLNSWNPFGPKATEFRYEFVNVINTEVLKEVRNLILNTRQVTEGGVRYYIYDSYNEKLGLTPSDKLTFNEYADVIVKLMRSTARNATGQFFAQIDPTATIAPDITVKIKRAENDLDNDVAWKNTQPTASQHQEEALRRHTIYSMAAGIKNRGAYADQAARMIEAAMQASRDAGNKPGEAWKTVEFNGVKYKTETAFNNAISAYDATGHAYVDVVDAINDAIRIKKSGALQSDAYGFTDLSLEQLNELASMAKDAERDQQGFDDFRDYIENTAYTRNVPGLLFRASMHERQSAYQPSVWSVGADGKRTLRMLGIEIADVEAQMKSNRTLLERKRRQNSIARTVTNEISKDDETFTIEQGFTFDYLESMDSDKADRAEFYSLFTTINSSNSGLLTKEFSESFIKELSNRPFVMKIGVEKATSAADYLTLNQTIDAINRLSAEIGDYKQLLKINPGDKDVTERMNRAVQDRVELNKRYRESFARFEKQNDPMFQLVGKKIDALSLLTENFADGLRLKGDARLEKMGELTGILYDLAVDMQGIKQNVDMKEGERRRFLIANLLRNAGARNARTLYMASTFAGYSESLIVRSALDKEWAAGTTLKDALEETIKDSDISLNELVTGLAFTTERIKSQVQSIISEPGEYEAFIKRVAANRDMWNGTTVNGEKVAGYLDQPIKDIQSNKELLKAMNNEIRTTEFLINKIVDNYRRPANAATDMSMLYEQLAKSVTPLEDMVLEMKRQHVLKNGLMGQESFSTAIMGATQRGSGEVQSAIKSALKRQSDVENAQMQRRIDEARLNQDSHYNLVARGMKRVLRDIERMEDAFGFLAKDKKSIPVDTTQVNAQVKQHGDYVSFIVLDEHVKGATSESWLALRGQRILVPASFYSATTGRVTFKSNHSFLPNNLTPMEKEAYILTSWFVENNAVDGLPIGRALSENVRNLFSRAISDFNTSKATERQFKASVLRYTNDVLDSLVMRFPLRNENLRYTNTGTITIKDQLPSDVPGKIQSWLKNVDLNWFRYSTTARNFNFEQLLTRLKADGIDVAYLSNKDLWALTEKQGSTTSRYPVWKELVAARDKYIVDPLKSRLEASSKLMSQMSFHELNMELRDSGWTNADRASFFADYWHITQTRQGNIPRDYMIATGEFPTPEAIRQYIDKTMQGKSEDERLLAYTEQVKNLEALEQMIATAGYEAAIKTSSITQAEVRYNNDPDSSYVLTGIMRDVQADALDSEQQQVRGTLLSQTELLTSNANSVVSDLLKQVGELKSDAKTLMAEFLNNPERLNIKNVTDILIKGSQPAGARNIKIPAMKGKTSELESETRRMAVHVESTATNNLKTLQENLKDGPLSLEISRNLAELGLNVGRGRVRIQDLISGHSSLIATRTMTTAQQQHVQLIASKVKDYVQAQARVLIGARLELLRSMNDFSYVGYEYRQNGATVDVYEQGVKKYTIDYKGGKVSTVNHEEILAIGSKASVADWSRVTFGLDAEFQEQLKALDIAQVKQLDLLITIAKRPGESYIGGSAETHADSVKTLVEYIRTNTKAVPAVYWHGIANMRRPENYGPDTEMYSQPAMSPNMVEMEYGTIDPSTRRSFVNPVISKWMQPSIDRQQRVVVNHNNEVGRDEIGYTVYREDGNRSHIYRNLVESGLSRNKALEVYALTEHPSFKTWASGTMLDNLESLSAGTGLTINLQVKPEQFKALRVFDAMKLRQTLKFQMTNPSEENYQTAKRLYGETLGSHLNDAQLDRSFDKLTSKGEDVGPIMMEVDKYIEQFMSSDIAKMAKIYDSQLQAEQKIVTGAPFTTLAFLPDVDGALYDSAPGIQVHDIVTGSHIRKNRMRQPRFIKMENPLVVDANNTGLSIDMRNQAIKDAVKGKHDGVVFTNVVQTAMLPETTAIAYTLNDANVRAASNMLGEVADSVATPTAKIISDYTAEMMPDEIVSQPATSPIMYQGKEPAPPLAVTAGKIKTNKTVGMHALDGLDRLEREWQGLTRLSLAMDLAYPVIQGGKYAMGIFTGRPYDTVIWLNAFRSAAKGLAPRLAFTGEKGKQIGAHMGRREYIKLFLEISNDPYYEVMKELGVPLNFYNYERAVHKARQRTYQEAKGKTNWQDVYVDLMQISEVGHVQQDMVKDAMVNKLPVAGMAERFTSLNHDVLMFNLVKWQLQNNPLLADVPLSELKHQRSAKEVANFVALSLGDFQYSTNEDIDMVVGRAAKWVSVAPRWQLANWLMKPHWNYLFGNMKVTRKLLGEQNRVFNSIASNQTNPALRNYQYSVIYGSMVFVGVMQAAVHYLGQLLFKREDIKADPTKVGKFRVGNWVYADSSGVWDDLNKLRTVYDAINKPVKTEERFGDTPELDWLVGASNRLGYNVSPALIKFIFEPLSGKDVIGRSVYETDEEWRYLYERKIKPAVAFAPEKWNMSQYITSTFPTGLNEVVDTTFETKYEDKATREAAILTQAIASTLGSRLQYDKYIPGRMMKREKIIRQHERNWQTAPNIMDVIAKSNKRYQNPLDAGIGIVNKTTTGKY